MQTFHNILYVAFASAGGTAALKQALSLARNNATGLQVLLMHPDLPASLGEHRDKYRESMITQLEATIQETRASLDLSADEAPVAIEAESGPAPSVTIIRRVLRNGHDLLLKEADPGMRGRGFRSVDMELLRKCPCPVWLARPISRHRGDIRVAVAVDPEERTRSDHDIAVRLLQLSRSLADTCSGTLEVVSCWSYEYEKGLRGNPWIRVSQDELDATLAAARDEHRRALEALIGEAGIGGRFEIRHLQGQPEEQIPAFAEETELDILVMGTLGRTGIPGFVIGNTAEDIIQQIHCSLVALKPGGFVSPVKAY